MMAIPEPPSEVVITARSLEPYAAALEQAFEDAGLPWTSSLASPLRRHPLVRDFLLMVEIAAEDRPIAIHMAGWRRWNAPDARMIPHETARNAGGHSRRPSCRSPVSTHDRTVR